MTTRLICIIGAGLLGSAMAEAGEWLQWKGPDQVLTSRETYEKIGGFGESPVWTLDLAGRGAPLFSDGKLVVWGYKTDVPGGQLREYLAMLDPATGAVEWEYAMNDFISDVIYNRYATGSPAIDAETRNLYLMTTNGLFVCVDKTGKLLWEHSLMEAFGRLTFPNGRSGCPVVEGDLVIVRGITTNWGSQGPARDRFYAFDKRTGEPVWSSTPGVQPQDSSFSTPYLETRNGKRVFYAGTGCGNVVAVNAMNGKPLWRFQMSKGGVNSSPLVYKDTVISIHGKENLDSTEMGRMVAIKIPEDFEGDEPLVLDSKAEVWRNRLEMFTSSPVLVGNRVYQLTKVGMLACVNADTGEILWEEKLASGNLHSSPLYVDGLLYVPMHDGKLHVIKPSDEGAKTLGMIQLEGNCLGSPLVHDGKLYLFTTVKLYCFQLNRGEATQVPAPTISVRVPGDPASLQAIPSEILIQPGDTVSFTMNAVDASGFPVTQVKKEVSWEKFIPPTAKVKSKLDADFEDGKLVAAPSAAMSAGMFKGTADDLVVGFVRGRILPNLPMNMDFEAFELSEMHKLDNVNYAYPPLPWIGARFKFEVRELDGNKVLAKTLDRVLFQRATAFIGHPELSNYTLQADVMTDGSRRVKSVVGLVNQRYLIALKGNWNQIEVSSNHERLKMSAPFPIAAKTWYTLKTRVDVAEDGSGVILGKAWPKGEEEPEAWTIEVPHEHANLKGAPGIFGFSPQSQKRVFVDNINITPNQ